MKKNRNVSLAKLGMNRDMSSDSLQNQMYTIALNMNIENESGNLLKLKSEHSNILASKFKDGYKVIGYETDINTGSTYFFLTNPTTNISEIGVIQNNSNIDLMSDVETQCSSCDFERVLNEPLEDTVQSEYLTYNTIVEDSCNQCLNFDIRFPIKKVIVKNEKSGIKIFFSDNLNPPRYLDLSRLDEYLFTGTDVCGVDETVPTCLACDKLRMFPIYMPIRFVPEEQVIGGNLPLGMYSFYASYANRLGNEMSEYTSLSNPVSIFDENNKILTNEERGENTNFAIKLDVNELDSNFEYYKIAVSHTNIIDGSTRHYEVGVFPATTQNVLLTTLTDKKEISVNEFLIPNPNVKLLEGLATSNRYLFGYGVTREKEWNLQPVVNLMGGFFKWQTQIGKEDLYEDGINNSLYKGYMRDEVYPLAISFTTDFGFTTARFPLIARPATAIDTQTVDNLDSDSIAAGINACDSNLRSERWQFYNTATEIGTCSAEVTAGNFEIGTRYEIVFVGTTDFTAIGAASNTVGEFFTATGVGSGTGIAQLAIPTNTVVEPVTKICTIDSVVTDGPDTFIIDDPVSFTSLEDFINIQLEAGSCTAYPFCPVIDPGLYGDCDPGFDNCATPVLDEEFLVVNNIVDEEVITTFIAFPDSYSKLRVGNICFPHRRDATGDFVRDTEFEADYIHDDINSGIGAFLRIFDRSQSSYNDSALYADVLAPLTAVNQELTDSYYHIFEAFTSLANGQQSAYDVTATSSGSFDLFDADFPPNAITFNWQFSNKLHKQALWFKVEAESMEADFIFELTKLVQDEINKAFVSVNSQARLSVFTSSGTGTSIYSNILNLDSEGFQLLIDVDVDADTLIIKESDADPGTTPIAIPSELYFTVDVPLVQSTGNINVAGSFITHPLKGCFGAAIRRKEIDFVEASYTSITFDKVQKYTAACNFEVPVVPECGVLPYKYGEFAYWESVNIYPDNPELYNSSLLNINSNEFSTVELAEEFASKYTSGQDGEGNYVLNEATDFTCEPIRHFKFPDNAVSPFMYENEQAGFVQSVIYPIGVTVDEVVINDFLDIAVANELITQEQRDSIVGYEIFRGDRTLDKGVVAKGLAYDMYSYEEKNKEILFPNFPYNSLGENELFLDDSRTNNIAHPFDSISNYNFTFHSPDTEFIRPTLPTEMKIEGYSFGKSRGVFDEVEGHPKYVILGREARRLASTLATLEVIAEALVASMQAFANYNQVAGFTNTVFSGAWVASPTIAAAIGISGAVFKYGRYKYEWLNTFRDLGSPENFAYYYTSVGEYNYLKTLQTEGESVRSILKSSYLPAGRFTIVNEVDGEKLEINNIDREDSVFITIGAGFPITYPAEYRDYDNTDVDRNLSSRFLQSTTFDCTSGRSEEFVKNIASPYVSIKNYLPSQYGDIDNISWLTTSYRGNLNSPSSSCLQIFGGDVFISRHTLKRKIPIFLTTGQELASRTPFNYRAYSNIGQQPRFYANFLSPDEVEIDRGLPDISTEYQFDCLTGDRDFYVKQPSKFYLYYYGIPSFLTETTINTNYRTGRPEQKDLFYPLVGDYVGWTQEKNVSIKERNQYFYPSIYSGNTRLSIGRTLPATYEKEVYDALFDEPNGVIYSLADNNENELTEPWLVFRPLDKYEFSTAYGKLVELRGIETQQMLARFENQSAIFNAVDVLVDGITENTAQLGTGGIFARRPVTFADTDLGYAGSQSFDMVSNEYGHFYTDAKRGQIIQVMPGGKGINEISANINGQPSGMRNWFKEHLPFKVFNNLVEDYADIDIDNPYNGLGIAMGWDSRYKRVFITKKDYKPLQPLKWACGAFYNPDLNLYQDVISTYEGNGFTFDGIVDCRLQFSRPPIPTATDIYAFFDTSSMQQADGVDAAAALNSWFSNYQALNPDFTGNLYIIPFGNEQWVSYPSRLVTGAIAPTTSGLWSTIAQLPPDLNTGSWVPPTDLVVLAFVDETNAQYHGNTITGGFSSSGIVQPTATYTTDFNQFVTDYAGFNYFRGVIYPIVQNVAGNGGALVLQALAAIEGTTLTPAQITATGTTVDVSILQTENPYSGLGGLNAYNWEGVYNKVSPASAVFNSGTFASELDELILEAEDLQLEFETLTEVDLTDEAFFEDVSWTVAYSLTSNSWISYYDFKPNYYVNHNNYFQTGINNSPIDAEFGLWSHLLTNKSFGVFYGTKYEIGFEYPTINNFSSKTLESMEIWSEGLRYHNDYDFAFNRDISFNKLVVSNHRESTGELHLVPQKTLRDHRSYPKTYGTYQEILMTNSQDRWKLNYLYNRVDSEYLNQPIWNWDTNQIKKTLNNNLVKFKGKRVLERLRGNFFLNYLGYDKDSRFEVSFKWAVADESLN